IVGQVLQGTFKRTTATATVTIDPPPPDASTRGPSAPPQDIVPPAAEVVPQGEFYRWSLADAPLSGIYTAHISGPPAVVERYAVNSDPRESDLVKLPSGRLTERTWSQVRFAYGTDVRDFSDSAPQFVAANGGNNWPRNLLLTALACALVETWWAGRI